MNVPADVEVVLRRMDTLRGELAAARITHRAAAEGIPGAGERHLERLRAAAAAAKDVERRLRQLSAPPVAAHEQKGLRDHGDGGDPAARGRAGAGRADPRRGRVA